MSAEQLHQLLPNLTIQASEKSFQIGLRQFLLKDDAQTQAQVDQMAENITNGIQFVNDNGTVVFRSEINGEEKTTFVLFTERRHSATCCGGDHEHTNEENVITDSLNTPVETCDTDIHVELYMMLFRNLLSAVTKQ